MIELQLFLLGQPQLHHHATHELKSAMAMALRPIWPLPPAAATT
jgi:hypothetical protein